MKNVIGKILTVLVGFLLGFFGVFNSVFSDGALAERLVTISIILIIYAILSALVGLFLPRYSWKWGFFICLPGVFILLLYMFREFNPYYLIYQIMLVVFSCLGAYIGHAIRSRKRS